MRIQPLALAVSVALSVPALAGFNIGGSAELNFVSDRGRAEYGDDKWHQSLDRALVIQFDGDHKLDQGGKLQARVSQKIAEGNQTPNWGNREAWVGFSGDWGSLRGGRQFLNSYLTLDWPYGQGGFWELAERDLGSWDGAGKITSLFQQNDQQKDSRIRVNSNVGTSINYLSPNWNGLSFGAQYAWDDNRFANGGVVDLSANYTMGALTFNGGYLHAKGISTLAGAAEEKEVVGIDAEGRAVTRSKFKPLKDNKDQQFYLGLVHNGGNLVLRALYTGYQTEGVRGKARGGDLIAAGTYVFDKSYVKLGWLRRDDRSSALIPVMAQKDFNMLKAEYGYNLASSVVAYGRVTVKKWAANSVGAGERYTQLMAGVWAGF
ncbi:porin [Chitinimonas lacunae]|uniref:Porin n=1 Tax=Chitinimonas lacunae TaxID=1963018 RepID=A0ABV8MNE3_9NEIS